MSVLRIKDDNDQWQTVTTWGDYYILGFSATLPSTAWSSNMQTITNSNLIANGYNYIVTSASENFVDYTSAQIYADDVTTDNVMTFHCTVTPITDLSVNIMKVKIS